MRAHPVDLYAPTPSEVPCALICGPLRTHPVYGPLRAHPVDLYALTPSVVVCELTPWTSTRSPRLWSPARSPRGPLRAHPVCGRMRAHPVMPVASRIPVTPSVAVYALTPSVAVCELTSSCSITSSCLMRFTTWFLHIITASYGVQGLIASCHIGTTKITH